MERGCSLYIFGNADSLSTRAAFVPAHPVAIKITAVNTENVRVFL